MAVFFAVSRAGSREPEGTGDWPQVWVLDSSQAAQRATGQSRDSVTGDPHATEILKRKELTPCVYPVNAVRVNERLAPQQGLFTLLGDPSRHLRDNMTGIPSHTIAINPALRGSLLSILWRMNISASTLFPGLQGLASSLEQRIVAVGPWPQGAGNGE